MNVIHFSLQNKKRENRIDCGGQRQFTFIIQQIDQMEKWLSFFEKNKMFAIKSKNSILFLKLNFLKIEKSQEELTFQENFSDPSKIVFLF
jgi:hypothetical protein